MNNPSTPQLSFHPSPSALRACPSSPECLNFPTSWYRFPNNDDFLICTKCFSSKLAHTALAPHFRYDYLDFGPCSNATCDFNTPRFSTLLQHALTSNSIRHLETFASRRMSIQSCQGTNGIKGGNDEKWFRPAAREIDGFICCEACYEDVVLATNFASYLIPYGEEQPADATWTCDLAIPYLRHQLQRCSQRRDWSEFVQAARHRMSLPACAGTTAAYASSRKWYNTIQPSPIPNFAICEACFLDRVGWREEWARNFTPVTINVYQMTAQYICDLGLSPMRACWDILFPQADFYKWHHYACIVASKPQCAEDGITDGEWYGLTDPSDPSRTVENFDICAACHVGWNESAGLGHLFCRLNFPPGTTRMCDFHPSAARHTQYGRRWNQMYFTYDVGPFISYVSRAASLPVCQGKQRIENAHWYGDPSASLLICPYCFHDVVHGTQFASAFPLQNALLPTENRCSLYSNRMRQKYSDACKSGSLDSLLAFALHREEVYRETIPQIQTFMLRQKQQMDLLRLAQQQRSQQIGITAVGRAFMGGNAIVHNYDPAVVLSTININSQMARLDSDPERPRMLQLEARWKEVE
ncbi:MAG: hypothetical protein Q9202_003730 [Teloschistes flavicans]